MMLQEDAWSKLWAIVAADPETPPLIEVDQDDPNEVTLVYEDGTKSGVYWTYGRWNFHELLDLAPCDVAARDSL